MPAPANNTWASATTLTGTSGVVSFTTVDATREGSEPADLPASDDSTGGTVWWKFVAPADGDLTVSSTLDPGTVEIYTGAAVGALTHLAHDSYDSSDPPPTGTPLLGMSAPASLWSTRKTEVEARGGALQARRIFFTSLTDNKWSLVDAAVSAGLYPVLSVKPGYTWASMAAGSHDSLVSDFADECASYGADRMFVCLNHEPGKASGSPYRTDDAVAGAGVSTPAQFANMNLHCLPILAGAGNVDVGVIMNGWMFVGGTRGSTTQSGNGMSDAELSTWLPAGLIDICDVVGADHYQISTTAPHALRQFQRHGEWAERVGAAGIGVGEFNDFTAAGITDMCEQAKADPLVRWTCLWNTEHEAADVLTGARLTAFQDQLISWPT